MTDIQLNAAGAAASTQPQAALGQEAISNEKAAQAVMVVQLASKLHDLWREPRRLSPEASKAAGVDFEPREKDVDGVKYDIANLSYIELPEKFQTENRLAAEGALDELRNISMDTQDVTAAEVVENLSNTIHEQWMERNGSWADAALMVPYMQLPEEEKEKDRVIARAAIEVYAADMSN